MTPRQRQAAGFAARGLTNKQIAREMGLHPNTVKHHVEAAMHRLGVGRRAAIGLKLTELDA